MLHFTPTHPSRSSAQLLLRYHQNIAHSQKLHQVLFWMLLLSEKYTCTYTTDHCIAQPFVHIILTLDSSTSNKHRMYQETNCNIVWHHTNQEQQFKSPTWALASSIVFHYFSRPLAVLQSLTPTSARSSVTQRHTDILHILFQWVRESLHQVRR